MQKHLTPSFPMRNGAKTAILLVDIEKSLYHTLSLFEKWEIRQKNVAYEPITCYPHYERMVKNTVWFIKRHPEMFKIIVKYHAQGEEHAYGCDPRITAVCNGNSTTIVKRTKDAFEGTELPKLLSEKGFNSMVVCGFSSTDCVRATIETGANLGFTIVTSLKLLSPSHPSLKDKYPVKVVFFRRLMDLNWHLERPSSADCG